ncbi:hypothetical protein CC80DRAFT_590365, partial [Byssothecium circinans]
GHHHPHDVLLLPRPSSRSPPGAPTHLPYLRRPPPPSHTADGDGALRLPAVAAERSQHAPLQGAARRAHLRGLAPRGGEEAAAAVPGAEEPRDHYQRPRQRGTARRAAVRALRRRRRPLRRLDVRGEVVDAAHAADAENRRAVLHRLQGRCEAVRPSGVGAAAWAV